MKIVIESTDGKFLGEIIEINNGQIVFSSGEVMNVQGVKNATNDTQIIFNSNYVIRVKENN